MYLENNLHFELECQRLLVYMNLFVYLRVFFLSKFYLRIYLQHLSYLSLFINNYIYKILYYVQYISCPEHKNFSRWPINLESSCDKKIKLISSIINQRMNE